MRLDLDERAGILVQYPAWYSMLVCRFTFHALFIFHLKP